MRLIQVGLGGWGRNWQEEAAGRVPGVSTVAYVDVAPESLAQAQRQLGLAPELCFSSLGDALAVHEADAALVTTSVPGHLPVAVEALKAGLHVLVEKPLGPTVAESQDVVALAERLGLVFSVSQNYRYYAAPQTVRRLVTEQLLGPLGTVRVDFRKWANGRDPATNKHYRVPHVLLYDMAIHHFDLMRMLLGQDPVEVYTKLVDPPWSHFESEAAAVMVITFSGGTTVSYRGSWVSGGVPTPWSGLWHLECEQGELTWAGAQRLMASTGSELGRERVRLRRHATGDEFQESSDPSYEDVPLDAVEFRGRAGTLHAFAEAVRTGSEPDTAARRNLPTLALCEAAVRSAESGRPEPLSL